MPITYEQLDKNYQIARIRIAALEAEVKAMRELLERVAGVMENGTGIRSYGALADDIRAHLAKGTG